ncbi:DNA polymerase III subunit delta' [Necropsobacter massiliensis]|uniref:DNA polymerase III subunit delta' n=1 Tax=Necropsobacter massiliensis TaxID=1400001 RepID=UPI000595E6AE|nr:DNA polymerase III subunit delta' [Necropsobacter massiliensis]
MSVDYPWLGERYAEIISTFQQGHGHHALLFRSEPGLGTERLINDIAAWLLCRNPQALQRCGQCHSCRLFAASNHPDFYTLAPLDNKDISIEQVRDVNEKITQHAQQQGNKVVYIAAAERLTDAAANALLKTLEEPRPNTYFLLLAALSAPLLATIHSRCQTWLIPLPAEETALHWLQAQCSAPSEDICTALRINYGRPLTALAALQQGWLAQRKDFLRRFWLFYTRRSPLELLAHFDKELVFQQLDWLASFLSDSLKAKLGVHQGWINADLVRGIEQFSAQQSALGLLKANEIVQQVRFDLLRINGVNQELILLDGLTRLITEVFEA